MTPSSPAAKPASTHTDTLSKSLLFILAVTAGTAVANLYYSQPMLALIADSFNEAGRIGLIAMCTQIGYTIGLVLLVPLGDRVNRRNLILALCLLIFLSSIACALAPGFIWLAFASVLVGIGATITQMVIPLAVDLASPESRGRAVGVVFSGLLCGILLARTVSGAVGQAFGWRFMFWLAAGIALLLAIVLFCVLPNTKPKSSMPYTQLLSSLLRLFVIHSPLRRSCIIQACMFGGFSAFWSVLALLLQGPPYHYGAAIAGAFGIVGLIGVGAASLGGRLTDRYGARNGVGAGVLFVLVSFLVFAFWQSLAGLVVGVIILDLGVSLTQVSNQTLILGLDAEARSRINTIYVTSIFFGGTFGSGIASFAWHHGGWTMVSMAGLALAAVALLVHIHDRWTNSRGGMKTIAAR
jgi:predicted MFS family arabinose efflux permease